MAKQMYFNITVWKKSEKKLKINFSSKALALAYLSDILTHMEKGKATKVDVYYSDKIINPEA